MLGDACTFFSRLFVWASSFMDNSTVLVTATGIVLCNVLNTIRSTELVSMCTASSLDHQPRRPSSIMQFIAAPNHFVSLSGRKSLNDCTGPISIHTIMSDEANAELPATVDTAAIRSELNNAFSTEDDSDEENFDLDNFRARRLAEQEATARSEQEEDYEEQMNGRVQSPQYIIRNSADLVVPENGMDSQPVSPFAVAQDGTDIVTPMSARIHSVETESKMKEHQDEVPESPYPHVRTHSIDDQDEGVDIDMPTQSFEDISLEEDEEGAATPNSAATPGSGFGDIRSPRSAGFAAHQHTGSGEGAPEQSLPSSKSTPLPDTRASTQAFDTQFKRTKKTGGRSALQKVISKTRPTHLPPKPKEEDVKHLKVWEDMMKKSRYAGKLW